MFEGLKFFSGNGQENVPSAEALQQRLSLAFYSKVDLEEAKKIAQVTSNGEERLELLNEIAEIENGRTSKFVEEGLQIERPERMYDTGDVWEEIEKGDLRRAKKIATSVSNMDEYEGVLSFIAVADAQFKKGENPKGVMEEARRSAGEIDDDPRLMIDAFLKIMKAEASFGLFGDVIKSAATIRSTATHPNWPRYNVNVFAVVAMAERDAGLSDEEVRNLDEGVVKEWLREREKWTNATDFIQGVKEAKV